ncbi:MAG TPA: DUF554 domain-containing protein [Bacillota bacterium]|nr:DUF554 domain-containing protein [Bacillota bacterium]
MPILTALTGTLANTGAVLVGGSLGLLAGSRLPERLRQAALRAVGLAVIWIGLSMTLGSHAGPLLVIGSMAVGSVIGEWLDLERLLERWTRRAEAFGAGAPKAFVLSSLVFCVGPLTILGAIQDGLSGQHALLFAKSLLDGITALLFASAMGVGVLLAAATVLIYQGAIALGAAAARGIFTPPALAALSGVGGLMILAIGLNLCEIGRFRTANLLPALVLAVAAAAVASTHGYTFP